MHTAAIKSLQRCFRRTLCTSEFVFDAVVIGAGVVGLAVTRALAFKGLDVVTVEAASVIGSETSSRNSNVIHAGIYYPPESLKAKFCVRGNRALYEHCDARGVACKRVGKLVIAQSPQQETYLHNLLANGNHNGVPGLKMLSAKEATDMEPEVRCTAALWSPSTGIVDGHEFMLSLQAEAESTGRATIALNSRVTSADVRQSPYDVHVCDAVSGEEYSVKAQRIVNAAGLHAARLATCFDGLHSTFVPHVWFAKGNYFALSRKAPFQHLIYPVPEDGGLGVHVTLDLAGQARFGPDVEWIDKIDYNVDPARIAHFEHNVRKYWPALPSGSLHADFAGIRPKLVPPGAPAADFMVQSESTHGINGLVIMYGIESPGFTSALPLADHVASLL